MSHPVPPTGGAFLLEDDAPEVFTPEQLPAEARLMAQTADGFLRRRVLPLSARLEAQEAGLMQRLLQEAGVLGLLAGGVPERYGGLGLSKAAQTLLAETLASHLGFAVSAGVHSGVSLLPLLFFGTEAQKQGYLPAMARGEVLGAFALSEANSGSDALGAQTRAERAGDGYVLSGTKLWITNAGFADLFTVFGKADGRRLSAFLVPRSAPGLSVSAEERKMGLCSSSTRRLVLDNVSVPATALLGEAGQGAQAALGALNSGRFSIGATALGAAKENLRLAACYARQRTQFGRPLAAFGLIRHKLAEMAVRIYALESMLYRTAGLWDALSAQGEPGLTVAREYAVECALMKFWGTEVMHFVADEALQIHGGYGYSESFSVAQAYRDARVFRIFEGTNEINRLAVMDQLRRRLDPTKLSAFDAETAAASPGVGPPEWVRRIRNGTRFVLAQAGPDGEQEAAAAISDMVAALYALESAWRRGEAGASAGHRDAAAAAVEVLGVDLCTQTLERARYVLASLAPAGARSGSLRTLGRLLEPPHLDTLSRRRHIADAVLDSNGYPW